MQTFPISADRYNAVSTHKNISNCKFSKAEKIFTKAKFKIEATERRLENCSTYMAKIYDVLYHYSQKKFGR